MLRIRLVNPPFAILNAPSFALTQLSELLRATFSPKDLDVTVHYLNMDFAECIGIELYNFISASMQSLHCGLGEWFFRPLAFPDSPENSTQYFQRFGQSLRGDTGKRYQEQITDQRSRAAQILDGLIDSHGLLDSDVVGITTMFAQNAASFALARLLKDRNPEVITLLGGANCESPMGEEIAKSIAGIDYVFAGPALVSFSEFVKNLINGEPHKNETIPGVFSSKRNVRQAPEPAQRLFTVLSPAPPHFRPDSGETDLNLDFQFDLNYEEFLNNLARKFGTDVSPVLFFETSRGCWWGEKAHCTFCGLNGATMHYRAMSPRACLEQFSRLFTYSDRSQLLQAVDNILPRSYLKEVLPFLDTPRNMKIFYEVKADLTKQELQVLANAGVTKIQPGIEALCTSTLRLMKKGTTAAQNIQFLKNCSLLAIEPMWNLLIGFPGEDEEVYRKYVRDLPLLAHLPPPSGVFPVRFDRYSPYFSRPEEYGLQLTPLDFYEYVYPLSADSLHRIAYFFADRNVLAPYAIAAAVWFKRLNELIQKWRTFWFSPGSQGTPQLTLTRDPQPVVIDTRFTTSRKYRIGDAGIALLEYLSWPRRKEDIVTHFQSNSCFDVEMELRRAIDRQLLFEENERFLSLVVQSAPSSTTDPIATSTQALATV